MKSKPRLRIRVKRAYDAPARSDGRRVLVDRIWPRGLSKDDAALDGWAKELAQKPALAAFVAGCERGTLTLVFAAKDDEHNNAVALKEYLERRFVASKG